MRSVGTGNLDNNVHKNKNVLLWRIKQFGIINMLWIKDARTSSILKLCILSKKESLEQTVQTFTLSFALAYVF